MQALGRLDARDWLHGQPPWWNPYVGIGLPLAGQLQSGPFFLPFVLLQHFFGGMLLLKLLLQAIAGQATCALLRGLGLGRAGCVAGGALYELGGNFAWFSDAPIMPVAFLPVLVLGVERVRDGRRGGGALVTVAIAYLVLAGFPETAYFCGLMGLAWTIWRLASAPAPAPAAALGVGARIGAAGVLGLLIASPNLLVFAQYLARAWPQPRNLAHAALYPANLSMYVLPYLLGPIHAAGQFDLWFHAAGFVGAGPVFTALLAACGRRMRGLRLLLLGWIVLALCKSADVAGVTALLNLLPAVPMTMFFRYVAPTVAFACAVLAGFAIDDVQAMRISRPRRFALLAFAAALCLVAAALWAAWPALARVRAAGLGPGYAVVSVGGALALLALLAMLCARHSPRRGAMVASLLCAEAVALFAVPLLSGTRQNRLDTAPLGFLRAHLGEQRYASVGPLGPNYGAYFRLRSINYNYLPLDNAWAAYAGARLDPDPDPSVFNGTSPSRALQFAFLRAHLGNFAEAGVKYVLAYRNADPFAPLPPPGVRLAWSDRYDVIYELADARPYFAAEGARCTLVSRDGLRVAGVCAGPARLLRRELFFPGWQAWLDGRRIPVRRAGAVFQSVALPAGPFRVSFRFVPPHIGWAWAGCALGLLGLLVEVLPVRRRRRAVRGLTAPHHRPG